MNEGYITIGHGYRTKSGKQRRIPMLFESRQVIEKYLDPKFRKADKYLSRSDYLFGRHGNTMSRRLNSALVKICRQLWPKRTEFTLHSLRHTFAVRYLTAPARGDSMDFRMYRLQRILGHASRTTTERYLKAIPYDLRL